MNEMRNGIDVSSYQQEINWEEAKRYIDFAIIRCGFGNNIVSQDDPYFKRNAEECTRLNIPFGTYLYSYATNLNMAQSEVDHTLRLIKNEKLEYPVFLDVEDRSQLILPKETLVDIVKYYCEKIEEAGYYVGIYASLSTFNGILNSEKLDPYDKWVAEWGKDFNYKGNSGMWQYTDDARVPGVPTRVDGDRAFYNYPEIIRKNGLNHLEPEKEPPRPPETVDLKYKEGDKVYLNGPLYKEENAKTVIRNYCNQEARIVKTNNVKGIEAPYELDIEGYAKENDLSETRQNRNCVCRAFMNWLKHFFQKY